MKVLGTALYDRGLDCAIEELIQFANDAPSNYLISASDAHVLVLAKTKANLKAILDRYYWNLPDGVPSVWMLKWKGAKQANRISGPPFFKAVIEATKNENITHFLCGGMPGVADQLKTVCESWGNQNIVGTISPPFKTLTASDYENIANIINQSGASIVWVGLGAPKQIYFAHALSKYTKVNAIITIGAAFDFHTDRVKKAPEWIQKIGFEWFYRLVQEPKRLFKRYFKTIPLFIWYAITDLIQGSKSH